MFEKMLFDMLGISKEQAQELTQNALRSFQQFENAITELAADVRKIKSHLGIDTEIAAEIPQLESEKDAA